MGNKTGYTFEQVYAKSKSRVDKLYPVVARATKILIRLAYDRNINIVIVQGLRTIAEQNALYAQGRTKPGNKVTNAKGGYSNHNFGMAIDFALLDKTLNNVLWDTNADYSGDGTSDWMEVVALAKKLGFAWGGDWKSIVDKPHFEMTFKLSTADYRNGRRPTDAQIRAQNDLLDKYDPDKNNIVQNPAPQKPIVKDEDKMTPEEKKMVEQMQKDLETLQKTVTEMAEQNKTLQKNNDELAKRVNLSGKEPIPKVYQDSVFKAKQAGAITTSADKSKMELNMIKMMDNLGLFDKKDADKTKEVEDTKKEVKETKKK